MVLNWNVDPEIISLGPITLRYYSLLFALGVVSVYMCVRWIFRREKTPLEKLEILSKYSFIGLLVGARLGHCLFYDPIYYLNHPIEIFLPIVKNGSGKLQFIGFQGLSSHGGVTGVLIAVYWYCRKTGDSFIGIFDRIVIAAPLAGFSIRIGNLFNSEIIGNPTATGWGFVFEQVDLIPRHPTQLYEAFAYLLIFAVLLLLYRKKGRTVKTGGYFGTGIVLIFTFRFIVEFFKASQSSFENDLPLDMGQILSVPFIIAGIVLVANSFLRDTPRIQKEIINENSD